MNNTDLERLFTDSIEDESILCTDSHKRYICFAQNSGVELQQINGYKKTIWNSDGFLLYIVLLTFRLSSINITCSNLCISCIITV